MEEKNIPQKPIKEVLEHYFNQNKYISDKTKDSIKRIVYCKEDRIIIMVTESGKEIIWKRNQLVHDYGWFFFVINNLKDNDNNKNKKHKGKP